MIDEHTDEQAGLIAYMETLLERLKEGFKRKMMIRTTKRLRGAVEMLLVTLGEPKPKEWVTLDLNHAEMLQDTGFYRYAIPSTVLATVALDKGTVVEADKTEIVDLPPG